MKKLQGSIIETSYSLKFLRELDKPTPEIERLFEIHFQWAKKEKAIAYYERKLREALRDFKEVDARLKIALIRYATYHDRIEYDIDRDNELPFSNDLPTGE